MKKKRYAEKQLYHYQFMGPRERSQYYPPRL